MTAGVGAVGPGWGHRRRGVSATGFLVTLAVLLLLLFVVLEFVNRWTRIPAPASPSPAARTSLDLAVRALSRDLGAAASGPLSAVDAIHPVSNNTPPWHSFTGPVGQVTEIRPGTDQLGLRGILRTPVLPLEPADRATGRPFPLETEETRGGAGVPSPNRRLRLYADGPPLSQVAALLKARPVSATRKRFFIAGGSAGRAAVARIVSFRDRTAPAPEGCAPPPAGCHVELTLDFADPDATHLNPRGTPDPVSGLGPLSWGGLLDDLVYFVAQGPKGHPPDYFSVNDPISLAHPRPYLAVAEYVGSGRWEVLRVADDVENLQTAFAVAKDGAEQWRADRPGARPLLPAELSEPGAQLLALRIAIVAKGTERHRQKAPADVLEEILPFDAPRPDRTFAPLGWTENPWTRVDFDRETRFLSVRFGKSR